MTTRGATRRAAASMVFALCCVWSAFMPQAAAQQPDTPFQEAHRDWTVQCQDQETASQCTMFIELLQPQTGQRIARVQLMAGESPVDSQSALTVLVPLGVRLENGLKLGIDDQELGSLDFVSCTRLGCMSRSEVAMDTVAAMAGGNTLRLDMVADSQEVGEPLTISVSLSGFTSAWNRLVELSRP